MIEHQAVMAHADWIIGRNREPGAGRDGGEVVFTGTVAELMDKGETLTAKHLRQCVGAAGWALKSIPPMA